MLYCAKHIDPPLLFLYAAPICTMSETKPFLGTVSLTPVTKNLQNTEARQILTR